LYSHEFPGQHLSVGAFVHGDVNDGNGGTFVGTFVGGDGVGAAVKLIFVTVAAVVTAVTVSAVVVACGRGRNVG